MSTQHNDGERSTIQALVSKTVLDEVDALVSDIQAKSPGRTVRRAEVVRDLLLVGLRERKRSR